MRSGHGFILSGMSVKQSVAIAGAFLLIILQGIHFSAQAQQPAISSVLVLRGGRLIDGTGTAPLEKSVVVIEGTRIRAVGVEGKVAIPRGAKVINTGGKTVIPGLVDGHDHLLSDSALALYLYWGVTTVGDMTNQPSWIMQEKRAADKADKEGLAVSPSLFTALGGIDFPPYGAKIYQGENLR